MKKTRVLTLALAAVLVLSVHRGAEAAEEPSPTAAAAAATAVAYADTVLATWPDARRLSGGFEYNAGMLMDGIAQVHRQTGDPRYLTWMRAYYDRYVDAQGTVRFNDTRDNLDYIQPGNGLIHLYQQTGDPRYATAARQVYDRLLDTPRNADGGFWHKGEYPNEMWADSIYMGGRFAARYGHEFGVPAATATALAQTELFTAHAMPAGTTLPLHAWDQDRNAAWADPATGLSPIRWSRGTGWYAMSLVGQLSLLEAGDPGRDRLLAILRRLAAGLAATQDPATGLWWQVLDQPGAEGNFLESSSTGFFTYTLAEGVRLGFLDESYRAVAEAGWRGLNSKLGTTADGKVTVTEAVEGMGVGVSYAEYVGHRRLTNSSHGLMAVMMAATAMARFAPV